MTVVDNHPYNVYAKLMTVVDNHPYNVYVKFITVAVNKQTICLCQAMTVLTMYMSSS